ncbi:MAG: hypothetical protein HY540_05185 [Deltaproteobacteria bacterium]|nr:hypothetical protein [Deltaproteobacteria bacterium]
MFFLNAPTMKFLPLSLQRFDGDGNGKLSSAELEHPEFLDELENEVKNNPMVLRNAFAYASDKGSRTRADRKLAELLKSRGFQMSPYYRRQFAVGEFVGDRAFWRIVNRYFRGSSNQMIGGIADISDYLMKPQEAKKFRRFLRHYGYSAREAHQITAKLRRASIVVARTGGDLDMRTTHERGHHIFRKVLTVQEREALISAFAEKIWQAPPSPGEDAILSIGDEWQRLRAIADALKQSGKKVYVDHDPLEDGHMVVYALGMDASATLSAGRDILEDLQSHSRYAAAANAYQKLREYTAVFDQDAVILKEQIIRGPKKTEIMPALASA